MGGKSPRKLEGPTAAGLMYSDTGGDGPVVVLLHGVLMNGTLWDEVVDGLRDRHRCIVPELPFGAHRTPMPDDAELDLESLAKLVAEFLVELDLHDVTLVCSDWGGAQLVVSPGDSDRVANLVLVSCEAFDNYPPGLPGRLLCLNASLPGGTLLTSQLLRPRFIRHLPLTFGNMTKKRVSNDQFMSWIHPLRHNRKVRRDLDKYLRNVPKKGQLLEWADQQRSFQGRVLIVWTREDKLMPPAHAERLAQHFENSELVWVDDSRTLIPIDQPEILTSHLRTFLPAEGGQWWRVKKAKGAIRRGSSRVLSAAQALVASDVAGDLNRLVAAGVKGVPTVYDKAMDANYLDPALRSGLGGSYHRIFDGGHTIAGAFKAARGISSDDTVVQEALGTIKALLRDASTPRGLPLATWDKSTFDSVTAALESKFGIPKDWFYELSSYDAADLLGAAIGVVSVIYRWNSADTEEFARLASVIGTSAAVSTNPLLMVVSVVAMARAYNKASSADEFAELIDGSFKGAATSGASLAAVAVAGSAGAPAGAALVVGVTVGVLAYKVSDKVSLVAVARFAKSQAAAILANAKVAARLD